MQQSLNQLMLPHCGLDATDLLCSRIPLTTPTSCRTMLCLLYANYTTQQHTDRSCLFCMPARPELMVMPIPYTSENCAADPLYNVKRHYTCKFICDLYFTNRDLANKILDLCSHFIPTSDLTRPPCSSSPPQNFLLCPSLNSLIVSSLDQVAKMWGKLTFLVSMSGM